MEPGIYDLHDLAISLVKQGQGTNYVIVKEVSHENWAKAELIIAPSLDPYIEEFMDEYAEINTEDNTIELTNENGTTAYTFHSLCEGDYDRLIDALTDPPGYIYFDGPLGSYQLRVCGPHQPKEEELKTLSNFELWQRYNMTMDPKSVTTILTSKDLDLDNRIRALYKLYYDVVYYPEPWSIESIKAKYGDYKVARYTCDRGLCLRVPDSEQSFVDYANMVRSDTGHIFEMSPDHDKGRYYLSYDPSKPIYNDPHPKLYKISIGSESGASKVD